MNETQHRTAEALAGVATKRTTTRRTLPTMTITASNRLKIRPWSNF